jgi:hypothetical protein
MVPKDRLVVSESGTKNQGTKNQDTVNSQDNRDT